MTGLHLMGEKGDVKITEINQAIALNPANRNDDSPLPLELLGDTIDKLIVARQRDKNNHILLINARQYLKHFIRAVDGADEPFCDKKDPAQIVSCQLLNTALTVNINGAGMFEHIKQIV